MPTKLSLTGVQLGQAVVAILAVLMISGEYSTGMIRTTLAAMPRRMLSWPRRPPCSPAWCSSPALSAVLGSLLAGRLILPGNGFTATHGYPLLSLADGPTLRAACGSVLYLALIALLSLGIAHRRPRLGRRDRHRARAALPVPDHRRRWSATRTGSGTSSRSRR